MGQPSCEHRRAVRIFHEELPRIAVERRKQRVKGFHEAQRQGRGTQGVE